MNCGASLKELDRDRVSKNRFEVMQSHEEAVSAYPTCRLEVGLQDGCRGRAGRGVVCGDLEYQSPIAVDIYEKANEKDLCVDRRRRKRWRCIE